MPKGMKLLLAKSDIQLATYMITDTQIHFSYLNQLFELQYKI
jgi:hypothetical protein